jgi:hypothetical protein
MYNSAVPTENLFVTIGGSGSPREILCPRAIGYGGKPDMSGVMANGRTDDGV